MGLFKRGKVEWKEIEGKKYFRFDEKIDRQKYFYGNLVTVFLIIFLLTFGGYFGYYIVKNKNAFYDNPFIYGVNRMDANYVSCSCFTDDGRSFIFNNTYFGGDPSRRTVNIDDITINETEFKKFFNV